MQYRKSPIIVIKMSLRKRRETKTKAKTDQNVVFGSYSNSQAIFSADKWNTCSVFSRLLISMDDIVCERPGKFATPLWSRNHDRTALFCHDVTPNPCIGGQDIRERHGLCFAFEKHKKENAEKKVSEDISWGHYTLKMHQRLSRTFSRFW